MSKGGIQAGDAVWTIRGDISELDAALNKGEQQVQGTTGRIVENSRAIGAAFTVAGAAVVGGFAVAGKSAMTFSGDLANVKTLGVTNIDELSDGAKDLSMDFGIDLSEAVGQVYQAISAGIPQDAAINVLEGAAKGAQAGVGTLTSALDLGTSTMNAWGMKGKDATETAANFEKIMGLAATAVKNGKTTIDEMGASIGSVAPLMSSAGISAEEFYASVAALTATGMPASQAMTQLKAAVTSILNPTSEAEKMAAQLGIQFDSSALASGGLTGMLETLKGATGGNIDQMSALFSSVEGLGAMLALTGEQSGAYTKSLNDMSQAQQNLNEMSAAFVEGNHELAWEKMKATMTVLAVEIGTAVLPAFTSLVEAIAPIIRSIAEFVSEHETLATVLTTVVVALGALSLALGTALLMLSPLLTTITAFTAVAATVGPTLAIVAGIISGPLVIAIGLVVAAIALWIKNFDEIVAGSMMIFNDLVEFFKGITETISNIWGAFVEGIIGIVTGLWDGIASVWDMGMGLLSSMWDGFVGLLQSGVDMVIGLVEMLAAPFIWLAETIRDALGLAGMDVSTPNTQPPAPHAEGGQLSEGMNIVGERGPEAIIKHGSEMRVITAENTAAMGGGGVTINMNANIASDMDVNMVAQRLGKMLQQRMTGIGYSPAASRI
jgi:TP901 family phage tail tape measure protein